MTSPVEKVEGTKSVGSPQQGGGKAEFSPPSDGSVEAASSNASSSSRGLNFFQLCKSFPSLSGSGGGGQVPTEQYIEAVNSLAEYISKLGLVFWSVRSDITNNCSIVRHYYVKNKEGNKYIEQLIANNKAETVKKRQWTASVDSKGKPVPPPVSTTLEALIWVHLSMTFFSYILHDLLAEYDASTKAAAADDKSGGGGNNARRGKPPTEDLVVFFRRAYEQTLAPHSTWLMNSLFEIILKGTPSRTQFLTVAMGSGPKNKLTEAEVFERMRAYLQLLEANNAQVKRAITQNGYSV